MEKLKAITLAGITILLLSVPMYHAEAATQKETYRPLTENTLITEENSYMVNGKITRIKKHRKQYIVYVTCNANHGKKYKDKVFSVVLTKKERKPFKKGNKVTLILYDCGTEKITDDAVVNIRKKWY